MTGLKVNPPIFFCRKYNCWSEYTPDHSLVFCDQSVCCVFTPVQNELLYELLS